MAEDLDNIYPKFNGWLLVNKEVGLTSRDCINKIQSFTWQKKCGHAGTLDKSASGILAIAMGKALISLQYLQNQKKGYEFMIVWGYETDTDEFDGNVLNKSDKIPSLDEINQVLDKFKGKIQQTPPKYSAIKINGKRLSDLTRKGIDVEAKPREIEIFELKILSHDKVKCETRFFCSCSKGTYVRSLARDMGSELKTFATSRDIKRTNLGAFNIEDAISLCVLQENVLKDGWLKDKLLPIEAVLDDIPGIDFSNRLFVDLLFNGIKLDIERYFNSLSSDEKHSKNWLWLLGDVNNFSEEKLKYIANDSDGVVVKFFYQNKFFGLGEVYDGKIHPRKLVDPDQI